MEKARGISITSTALQFPYRTCVINLLDTPGHADFSEVLTAVDSAVMLIDAAKGLEPQTLKLFQVCKHRRIPIITVINKWDRPGRRALELGTSCRASPSSCDLIEDAVAADHGGGDAAQRSIGGHAVQQIADSLESI